ncbi:MAG TPA: hypothetical protein VGF07_11680, partial [Stellaceae bacterium]
FDAYRPFRPRFYATFWPATHQVTVRYVGENDNTQELEDLSYNLNLTIGSSSHASVYLKNLLAHRAFTNWTKVSWIGVMPSAQVNIDYNLGYLTATHFLPNYDPATGPSAAMIAAEYALWTGKPHDLYDGQWDGGLWQSIMSSGGERQEIGPYPTWAVMWAYSGDWRLRQMALGMADLAGAFPGHLREGAAGKRLLRSDPAGSSSGLGRAVSLTDRKTLVAIYWTYAYTTAGDAVKIVGPRSTSGPWTFDDAHQPQPFFVPYLLTGDPWYLDEMYLWAGFTAALTNGAATGYSYGRGPTGAEGGEAGELRAAGWLLRSRAEAAFAAPDSDPEKAYFTTLTNDALARWEGGFGLTGTAYDGSAEKVWGASVGNHYTNNNGPQNLKPPTLHGWESNGFPNGTDATIVNNQNAGIYAPGMVGSFTAPWMQNFVLYGLGRAKELGFAAGPLLDWTAVWLNAQVAFDGRLLAVYQQPVEANFKTNPSGGFFPSWAAVEAALAPAYTAPGGGLNQDFAGRTLADSYLGWLQAGASYVGAEPGGAATWTWYDHNVRQPIAVSAQPQSAEPKWAILPRTDGNALPTQPTH